MVDKNGTVIQIGDKIRVVGDRYNNFLSNNAIITKFEKPRVRNFIAVFYKTNNEGENYCMARECELIGKMGDKVGVNNVVNNNKPMDKINIMAQKLLGDNTKALIRAEFLNESLDLTVMGKDTLLALLFMDKKDEMIDLAKKIVEKEAEKK